MTSQTSLKTRGVAAISALLLLATLTAGAAGEPQASPLRILMVGGGPTKDHNQVAIESNVRYVHKLLPPGTIERVLFSDGDLTSENVQYQGDDKKILYRTPQLPRLDGPSKSPQVLAELASVADDVKAHPNLRPLLYFTGHGSPNPRSEYLNNQFDLWQGDRFTVKDFAGALKAFPNKTPITVVMVQCYSGAFGNILFEDGDPTQALIDKNLCGFFASIPQRPAAGCTPEINEAEYKDFTSYFFAALTGTDRVGRTVTGADYNHDGKVGMNEAFDYALLNDDSIDTPICTSDTFLRKFVTMKDEDVFKTPFSKLESWASPGQKVAVDGLAKLLNLSGEDLLGTAFQTFATTRVDSMKLSDVRMIRFVRLAKSIVLGHTLTSGNDRKTKGRYEDLLKLESGNPLKT